MLVQNKQIAVVGGGPGGLILARLLQLKGANVTVYERDKNKDARLIGSPLDMHQESGMAALRKAGLAEEFKQNFRPGADRKVIVNEQADIVFSDHDTKPAEDFDNKEFHPEIDRYPLRNLLLNSLQPGTVVWDSHCIKLDAQGEGWLLHFKNGSSAYADIVIAADGANSKIRPYVTNSKAFYTGIVMLEGDVMNPETNAPHIYSLLNGGKLMAFGNNQNILLGLKGTGELTYYLSFRAKEDWAANSGLNFSDAAQLLEWFKKEYAGWSPVWYELIENATPPFVPRAIVCMPLDQSWQAQPNITLIGDAAHAMPPFAGEGANMAMLDALELSECLTSNVYQTVQEAIAAYETNMRRRASEAARQSLQNGERMHSEGALDKMLKMFGGRQD